MGIRALLAVGSTLVLGWGCAALHSPTSSASLSGAPDIQVVDLDVDVKELPGLFQVTE